MNSSYRDLILLIKQRPSMYLGANSISCLKAYLDGWTIRNPNDITDGYLLDEFGEWIENRFNKGGTQSFVKIILFYSSDECSALKRFFELFDEFLIEYDKRVIT